MIRYPSYLLFIAVFFISVMRTEGKAQMPPPAPMKTSTKSSPTLESFKKLEKPAEEKPQQAPLPPPVSLPKPALTAQHAVYFYPGIIVNQNGSWQGGDDLLNLSSNIGLYFNIVKPANDELVVDVNQLKSLAENLFKKANIIPVTLATLGKPPLPFLQIQLLIYPIAKQGYVASCEARLFEAVNLSRIQINSANMAFQAVTWQNSTLIISPVSKIQDQIHMHVENIVKTFIASYEAFNKDPSRK